MMTRILVTNLVFLVVVSGADLSGKYKGALASSNGGRMNVLAAIRQQGENVTGTIGPTAMQQASFEDVTFTNGRLSFRIAPLGGLRFTFTQAGDALLGTLSMLDGTQPGFDRVALQRIGPITLADTMPRLANEGPFRSIRILKLREDLERNPDALNKFWISVRRSGAPLVEADPSDERFQYATFLWKGLPEHKNVLILWMPFRRPVRPTS